MLQLLALFLLAGCSSTLADLGKAGKVEPADSFSGPVREDVSANAGQRSETVSASGASRQSPPTEPSFFPGTGVFTQAPTGSNRGGFGSETRNITLNLVDADLQQAAKAVIAEVLHANYVISDGVKGRVTIQTTNPVGPSELLGMLESSLRAQGVAIVNEQGSYRFISAASADGTVATLDTGNKARGQFPVGVRVKTVSMKFIGASEMERVLRPMAPKGTILRVDEARNSIMLSGSDKELVALTEAISVFDTDYMRSMSFALIPLKIAQPYSLAKELEAVFSTGQEGPLKGVIKFIPNRRLNAILVVASQPIYLKKAATWIDRLDKSAKNAEQQFFVYHIQNRPAGELVKVIQDMLGDGSATPQPSPEPPVAPRFSPVTIGSATQPLDEAGTANGPDRIEQAGQPPLILNGTSANAESPDDGNTQINFFKNVRIRADEPNNSLLVTATRPQYERLLKLLEQVDGAPNQVLLEATIAEVTLNDKLKFGIKWYFDNGKHEFTLTDAASGVVAPNFPGFSYFLSATNMKVALSALADITKVRMISSPSLMVLDNRTAVLQVGDQVPIATQSAVGVLTPGAPVVNSISFKDTGVILSVTPRINDNGSVLLDIQQEVSDVSRTTSSGIDSPTIQQRKVKTTVAVQDGESLTLGGLIQTKNETSSTQVPILGDLPVVGNAFKQKTNSIDNTELIIIITPHVVRDTNEARMVTEEFRQGLNFGNEPLMHHPDDWRAKVDRVFR